MISDWIEIENDLSKVCLKKELILKQSENETNLWILSSSFTSTDRMYFILSTCNSTINTTNFFLTYKLILTNGNDLFTKHFSNDERGLLELFIASTIMYTIILLIILRYIYFSKYKSFFLMKLYCSSILCSWLYCLISFIDTLMFALTGYMDIFTFRLLLFLAHFIVLIAEILFLFILILCSKGYLIFILRKKHFFLQTKLNQINITYIHSITSKSHSNQISTREIVNDINSYEFTDLCYDEVNTWVSRFRIPFKSSEPLPRLEPRRDVKLKSLAKSSQSSMCIVPRRLATLNSNDQF
ncbi:unnamed protein product [Adineta steineri]|uniref:Uncharacterized protein n=2 Tax=Adineta steineri TaxID=433720 RepID=A0A819HVS6_9BILA|nr:unnamed protein product [Adineta steineri]